MQRRSFGKTGLDVSVLGLGGGGYSRLGTVKGGSEENSVQVIRRALELGVNLFDTAESYGTEPLFGKALQDVDRSDIVLCTKAGLWGRPPEEFEAAIDQSLRNLNTDYIDLYQVHGVNPESYPETLEQAVPILEKARDAGKIRFIGVTEQFERDTAHETLLQALEDPVWDTMMVGCNLLNFSAVRQILPSTSERGIGVLGMFAVRDALVNQDRLATLLHAMQEYGQIELDALDLKDPLGFLFKECETLPEAAYRFCRHLPGIDTVLSGTGSIAHLEANAKAVDKPPLSAEALQRINELFGAVQTVSGKSPDSSR